jgi:hypothetical protein
MTCRYFMQWFAAFKCFESRLVRCRVNSDAVLIIFDRLWQNNISISFSDDRRELSLDSSRQCTTSTINMIKASLLYIQYLWHNSLLTYSYKSFVSIKSCRIFAKFARREKNSINLNLACRKCFLIDESNSLRLFFAMLWKRKRCRLHKRTSEFHYHSRINKIRQKSNSIRIQYICRSVFAITTKTIFFVRTMLEAISEFFWIVYIHSTYDNIFFHHWKHSEKHLQRLIVWFWDENQQRMSSSCEISLMRILQHTHSDHYLLSANRHESQYELYTWKENRSSQIYKWIFISMISIYNRLVYRRFFTFFSFQ